MEKIRVVLRVGDKEVVALEDCSPLLAGPVGARRLQDMIRVAASAVRKDLEAPATCQRCGERMAPGLGETCARCAALAEHGICRTCGERAVAHGKQECARCAPSVAWLFEQQAGGAWHVVDAADGTVVFAADSAAAARDRCQRNGWFVSKAVPLDARAGG